MAPPGSISDRVAAALPPSALQSWGKLVHAALERVPAWREARRLIHSRAGFRLYANLASVKDRGSPTVSVRLHGVEVGQVRLFGRGMRCYYPPETSVLDAIEESGVSLDSLWGSEWASPSVARLFKHLRARGRDLVRKHRQDEHAIESSLIEALAEDTNAKANWARGIQPVLIGGLPFQFPVPLSPSDGKVRPSKAPQMGHVDIVARTQFGHDETSVAILELKKPGGDAKKAIFQALVYASALHLALESEYRTDFAKLLGFRVPPRRLFIRAFGVVAPKDAAAVVASIAEHGADPLVRRGAIGLGLMTYELNAAGKVTDLRRVFNKLR